MTSSVSKARGERVRRVCLAKLVMLVLQKARKCHS